MRSTKGLVLVFGLLVSSVCWADRPAIHGTAVFGRGELYFSHLPMFHSPHDYQVIFSGGFDETGLAAYTDGAANPSRTFYTFAPEPFDLPGLVAKLGSGEIQKSATLFTGVFDEGGAEISPRFIVSFKRVLYFKKLNPTEPHPSHPVYVLFGSPDGEVFMAHQIHSPPDFDQILKVESASPAIADSLRRDGKVLISLDEVDGDRAIAAHHALGGAKISVGDQVYFNSDDLAN